MAFQNWLQTLSVLLVALAGISMAQSEDGDGGEKEFAEIKADLLADGRPSSNFGDSLVDPIKEADVERVLENIVGVSSSNVQRARLAKAMAALRPIFTALPKDKQGLLSYQTSRYAIHRWMMQEHGWFIRVLEPSEEASMHKKRVDSEWVPSYVEGQVLKRSGALGVSLSDLATMAATIEDLIFVEIRKKFKAVYIYLVHLCPRGRAHTTMVRVRAGDYHGLQSENNSIGERTGSGFGGFEFGAAPSLELEELPEPQGLRWLCDAPYLATALMHARTQCCKFLSLCKNDAAPTADTLPTSAPAAATSEALLALALDGPPLLHVREETAEGRCSGSAAEKLRLEDLEEPWILESDVDAGSKGAAVASPEASHSLLRAWMKMTPPSFDAAVTPERDVSVPAMSAAGENRRLEASSVGSAQAADEAELDVDALDPWDTAAPQPTHRKLPQQQPQRPQEEKRKPPEEQQQQQQPQQPQQQQQQQPQQQQPQQPQLAHPARPLQAEVSETSTAVGPSAVELAEQFLLDAKLEELVPEGDIGVGFLIDAARTSGPLDILKDEAAAAAPAGDDDDWGLGLSDKSGAPVRFFDVPSKSADDASSKNQRPRSIWALENLDTPSTVNARDTASISTLTAIRYGAPAPELATRAFFDAARLQEHFYSGCWRSGLSGSEPLQLAVLPVNELPPALSATSLGHSLGLEVAQASELFAAVLPRESGNVEGGDGAVAEASADADEGNRASGALSFAGAVAPDASAAASMLLPQRSSAPAEAEKGFDALLAQAAQRLVSSGHGDPLLPPSFFLQAAADALPKAIAPEVAVADGGSKAASAALTIEEEPWPQATCGPRPAWLDLQIFQGIAPPSSNIDVGVLPTVGAKNGGTTASAPQPAPLAPLREASGDDAHAAGSTTFRQAMDGQDHIAPLGSAIPLPAVAATSDALLAGAEGVSSAMPLTATAAAPLRAAEETTAGEAEPEEIGCEALPEEFALEKQLREDARRQWDALKPYLDGAQVESLLQGEPASVPGSAPILALMQSLDTKKRLRNEVDFATADAAMLASNADAAPAADAGSVDVEEETRLCRALLVLYVLVALSEELHDSGVLQTAALGSQLLVNLPHQVLRASLFTHQALGWLHSLAARAAGTCGDPQEATGEAASTTGERDFELQPLCTYASCAGCCRKGGVESIASLERTKVASLVDLAQKAANRGRRLVVLFASQQLLRAVHHCLSDACIQDASDKQLPSSSKVAGSLSSVVAVPALTAATQCAHMLLTAAGTILIHETAIERPQLSLAQQSGEAAYSPDAAVAAWEVRRILRQQCCVVAYQPLTLPGVAALTTINLRGFSSVIRADSTAQSGLESAKPRLALMVGAQALRHCQDILRDLEARGVVIVERETLAVTRPDFLLSPRACGFLRDVATLADASAMASCVQMTLDALSSFDEAIVFVTRPEEAQFKSEGGVSMDEKAKTGDKDCVDIVSKLSAKLNACSLPPGQSVRAVFRERDSLANVLSSELCRLRDVESEAGLVPWIPRACQESQSEEFPQENFLVALPGINAAVAELILQKMSISDFSALAAADAAAAIPGLAPRSAALALASLNRSGSNPLSSQSKQVENSHLKRTSATRYLREETSAPRLDVNQSIEHDREGSKVVEQNHCEQKADDEFCEQLSRQDQRSGIANAQNDTYRSGPHHDYMEGQHAEEVNGEGTSFLGAGKQAEEEPKYAHGRPHDSSTPVPAPMPSQNRAKASGVATSLTTAPRSRNAADAATRSCRPLDHELAKLSALTERDDVCEKNETPMGMRGARGMGLQAEVDDLGNAQDLYSDSFGSRPGSRLAHGSGHGHRGLQPGWGDEEHPLDVLDMDVYDQGAAASPFPDREPPNRWARSEDRGRGGSHRQREHMAEPRLSPSPLPGREAPRRWGRGEDRGGGGSYHQRDFGDTRQALESGFEHELREHFHGAITPVQQRSDNLRRRHDERHVDQLSSRTPAAWPFPEVSDGRASVGATTDHHDGGGRGTKRRRSGGDGTFEGRGGGDDGGREAYLFGGDGARYDYGGERRRRSSLGCQRGAAQAAEAMTPPASRRFSRSSEQLQSSRQPAWSARGASMSAASAAYGTLREEEGLLELDGITPERPSPARPRRAQRHGASASAGFGSGWEHELRGGDGGDWAATRRSANGKPGPRRSAKDHHYGSEGGWWEEHRDLHQQGRHRSAAAPGRRRGSDAAWRQRASTGW
eukprot:TRINITY_DN7047_c1_g3_i3.p1 TRINITY_DN7047_c1_g3~~TRINITY_DN7047_c1_g3_i3.p1  ORF type:complete len:2223 (-),score=474.02 TRINITY_DN7047_c1_g3_i3:111-6779(-)